MFRKLLLIFIAVFGYLQTTLAQPITVTGIVPGGKLQECGPALPIVTCTYVSGAGSSVSGGVLNCIDPCDTTIVDIVMSNLRWNKGPDVNWIHGVFFPSNAGFSFLSTNLSPANWSFQTAGCTGINGIIPGSCGSNAGTVGSAGWYYAGPQPGCCPGGGGTPNPCDNWGDPGPACGVPLSFSFRARICNNVLLSNQYILKVKLTADGNTGCWSDDDIGSNSLQFSLAVNPCTTPLYSPNPTATPPLKTCLPSLNYTATLNGGCGNGNTVTWWTAAVGGTQVGTGSPFVYDPPGSACPSGTTLYAACCPAGNICTNRKAFLISGPCIPSVTYDSVYRTNRTCAAPTNSIDSIKVLNAALPVSYNLMPGNITNTTGIFLGLAANSYTVTATDALGCSIVYPISFTQPICGGPITAPITYCQNAVAVPLTATNTPTGVGLTWYTAATGGVGSTTAPTPSTTTVGPITYYVTETVSGIESVRVPLVVTIVAQPLAPTVAAITYCQNATPAILTATGTGLLWYTTATGGVGSTTAPTPSTTTIGSTTYYVSQTVGTCESLRASLVVTILALPSAPVTAPLSYCLNSTATALSATGTNLLWYTGSTGGVGSTTAPTPSTTTVGSTTYYVSQTVGTCESPRASLVVTILALPAAPTTATITYCQNTTAVALTAIGTNLLWYTGPTGGVGSATAPTPITTTAGTTTYYVSQTVGTCESLRASLVVTITPTPATPTVTSPVTYCQNDATIALTATGTGLLWYTTPTGGSGSTTAPTPSSTTIGSTTYYVSQTITSCEGPRAAIVVTIVAPPAAPTVVATVDYCQGATATVLTATGTNLQWYTVPTGGAPLASAPTPNTTSPGNITYYVSQTAGTCVSPRAAILVTIKPTPTAPVVTTPIVYCQNTPTNILTAAGTNLQWYTVPTGGVALAGAPTPSSTASGITTYYVSQTILGCESPRVAIVVDITPTPAAPTVTSPVTYCQNDATIALTATGTGLLWYTAPTGGSGSTTAPTPSSTTIGSTTYYVSQTITSCEGPRASIVVTIVAPPAAPTVSTITYCQGTTATALTAIGTNLQWYTVPTGGVALPSAPTPSTITAGTTTYYVSQTAGTCVSPRSAIVVTVNPTPIAPTIVTPVLYCQNDIPTILSAVGTNLQWYTVPTGGVALTGAPTPSTTSVGSITYYVSSTIGTCEGPRAAIVVTVSTTPLAPTVVSPVIYCLNVSGTALTATGTNLQWYTTSTGGIPFSSLIPNTSSIGSTTYYVSSSVGTCEGPRTALVVTVNPLPVAPVVTSTVTYCQNITATALTAGGVNLLWYNTSTGGTGSITAPIPNITLAGATTYYVSQTVNGCEGPRSSITVTVNATPSVPVVTTPVAYCQGAVAAQLTATGTNLLWYTAPTTGVGSATAPTPLTTSGGTTTYYVSQTINGCEGPRAAIVIDVTATPALPTVTSPVTYCQGATPSALAAIGTNLLWYTASTGGIGNTTAPTPSTSTVSSNSYYVSQTINGCEGPRVAILVTINPLPVAPVVTSTVTYCQNITATALTAGGTNLLWYTVSAGGTGSTAAPIPNTTLPGSTTYYVSQTVNGCEGPRASITITVNATPSVPVVTTPVAYCQGAVAAQLTATGTNLLWFTAPTTGVGSATAPTPLTTSGGTTTYYVSQTINGCEGPRAAIVIDVTATPALPTVTSLVTYCQGATPSALAAIGTNLLWYTASTGGVGNTTAPTPSTSTVSSTSYYVSQTINGCEGPRETIVVNVNITPAIPSVISPVVYCQGITSIALTAAGTNLLWYTNSAGGTGSTTAPIPSTTAVGNTIYYVSQTTGTCEGPRTGITVTVNTTPAAPTATSPIAYCQGVTATALIATGTNLLWYTVPTGGVSSNTAPTPSTTTAGTTTYYVSSTVGTCEGPRRAIVVNVTGTPLAPLVTSPITYCQGITATALTATGTNLLWYTSSIGGTGSSTAPIPSTSAVGSTIYYVSQSTNGCEGPRIAITVNVNITPTAPSVTSPVIYCQSATTIALTATGTNLLWYNTSTGGTGTATAPIPSSTTAGSTTYYVSQTTGTCEGPRVAIVVTINPTPALPTAASPIAYCQGATATALVATGSNLLWYTVSAGGTSSTIAPVPSTVAGGTTIYYVSQTILGCEGPRRAITVNVTATPALPAVTGSITYCQNATATALTATGTNLLWYTVSTGGTSSTTAPIPSTVSAGTTNYYVSQSTNGCEGPRSVISVQVFPTPTAPTTVNRLYCQNAPTTPLTAIGSNLLWYTSNTGGTGSATPIPALSTANAGVTTYYVSQTVNGCVGPRSSLVITVIATPAKPTVVSPVTYCPGDPAIPLIATGTNLLWYTVPVGGTGSSLTPTPSTATGGVTTYYVSQTSTTGSCEGPRESIVVNVNNNSLVVNIGKDTTICEGQSVVFTPSVVPAASVYEWRAIGVSTSTLSSLNTLSTTVNPVDTATYILKATNGGCATEDTVKVNVIWKPIIEAGLNKAICLNESIIINGVVTRKSNDLLTYSWTPTDSLRTPNTLLTIALPTLSTWYKITYQTNPTYGCNFTGFDSVKVVVQPKVNAFAGNDTIGVKGIPHNLRGTGGLNYTWTSTTGAVINNPFSQNAQVILNNDGNVNLKVTDAIGCIGYDNIFIKVYDGPTYYIPNSFTPNGDGLNDIFRAVPVGISKTTYFRVFNRFGELMFETNQWLKGWDGTFKGKDQPTGTYVWIVSGTDRDFKAVDMKGTVNLIR
jgi:gliding motility-associated-like protein